jgi:hypothetical protein
MNENGQVNPGAPGADLLQSHLDNGSPGETVFIAVDMALAEEMRSCAFLAVCYFTEAKLIHAFVDRRRVVIVHRNRQSIGQAYAARGSIEKHDHAQSIGVIDLEHDMLVNRGFAEWWADEVSEGNYDNGGEFIDRAQALADRNTPPDREVEPEPEAEPWPELCLKEAPEAAPFPVQVFPEPLQRFCHGVGQVTLTPPDMAGCAMLAVASAAIGQSTQVVIKRTWKESPLLYLLTVADPGKTKSPVIKLVGRPLTKIDSALRKQSSDSRALWEAQKKAAPKGSTSDEEPPQRRAIVKDITRETLVAILRDNPRGVLVNPDEATAWVASFNEYKAKGSDRQFWLDVWGSGPISVDREGGRRSLWVSAPLVTVMGGLPPDMLSALSEEHGRNDGFLDRILFCYPDKFPKQEWTEEELDQGDETMWASIIGALHAQDMFREDSGELRPHFVGFDQQAKAAYVAWYNAHCEDLESLDMPPAHVGVWSKMRAYCLRFALILSRLRLAMDPEIGAELVKAPVSLRDVQGAIELVTYFKSHFTRINHRMTGGTGSREAMLVLAWISRNKLVEFSERELRKDHPRRFPSPEDVRPALTALMEAGAIRRKFDPDDTHRKGRKPTAIYEINPSLGQSDKTSLRPPDKIDKTDKTPFSGF